MQKLRVHNTVTAAAAATVRVGHRAVGVVHDRQTIPIVLLDLFVRVETSERVDERLFKSTLVVHEPNVEIESCIQTFDVVKLF